MVATRKPPPKSPTPLRTVRCAIYCRKSTDENLDSDFNSLDAQREAAEAYIASQKHEGWVALPERYDDPGFSGATMDRPALQRLLADVERERVDCLLVYKVDRLSRSLLDFLKIVEIFEERGVSLVAVSQPLNTTTPMGRLTLHMLLSFGQFEREIIGERIRDKVAANKRRGKHCGGMPVLGYDTDRAAKRLVVNELEARLVKHIFTRFCALGSAKKVADELNGEGHRTKSWPTLAGRVHGGRAWDKIAVNSALNNRKYRGEVEHKGSVYVGEHQRIVPQSLWDAAHRILAENHRARANKARARTPALLRGVLKCASCRCSMGPTFSKKRGKTYRYYLCTQAAKKGYASCPVRNVAAGEIESAVIAQLRAVFRTPEIIARTFRAATERESEEVERLRAEKSKLEKAPGDGNGTGTGQRLAEVTADLRALEMHAVTEREVAEALQRLDGVWKELFPGEQNRIVQLLVERVEVSPDGLEVRIRGEGLRSLVAELSAGAKEKEGTACP